MKPRDAGRLWASAARTSGRRGTAEGRASPALHRGPVYVDLAEAGRDARDLSPVGVIAVVDRIEYATENLLERDRRFHDTPLVQVENLPLRILDPHINITHIGLKAYNHGTIAQWLERKAETFTQLESEYPGIPPLVLMKKAMGEDIDLGAYSLNVLAGPLTPIIAIDNVPDFFSIEADLRIDIDIVACLRHADSRSFQPR